MNRDTLWAIARERAVMDRQDFLAAWEHTDNKEVRSDTQSEIARFVALKGIGFKDSMTADSEGVRLALLAAQCWYSGLEDAQVGREKRHAAVMFKRVKELRIALFGITKMETAVANAVSIPINKVDEMRRSGLAPAEFLATLSHR